MIDIHKATVAFVATSFLIGTYDNCYKWCESIRGQDVWVINKDGNKQLVGKITGTVIENLDAAKRSQSDN